MTFDFHGWALCGGAQQTGAKRRKAPPLFEPLPDMPERPDPANIGDRVTNEELLPLGLDTPPAVAPRDLAMCIKGVLAGKADHVRFGDKVKEMLSHLQKPIQDSTKFRVSEKPLMFRGVPVRRTADPEMQLFAAATFHSEKGSDLIPYRSRYSIDIGCMMDDLHSWAKFHSLSVYGRPAMTCYYLSPDLFAKFEAAVSSPSGGLQEKHYAFDGYPVVRGADTGWGCSGVRLRIDTFMGSREERVFLSARSVLQLPPLVEQLYAAARLGEANCHIQTAIVVPDSLWPEFLRLSQEAQGAPVENSDACAAWLDRGAG